MFGLFQRRTQRRDREPPTGGRMLTMQRRKEAWRARIWARRGLLGSLLAVIVLLASAETVAAHPNTATDEDVYYLSLGDSLAVGYQPPARPPTAYKRGYADQLFEIVHAANPSLRLVKLGCGGETTDGIIDGVDFCPYPDGSQLAQAVDLVQSHPGRIRMITIDAGGNDVFDSCMDFDTGVLDPDCVNAALPGIQANLRTIIQTLRAAAPGVPIYGMTYHDPLLGFWVLGPNGSPGDPALAQADAAAWDVFNEGLVAAYEAEGVPVADVAGAFAVSDFTHFVQLRGVGLVPLSVANDCTWTWNCTPPPLGWDPHANTAGYGVIAQAFADVLEP
jgi:lysophospholipase L1-like esterase